MPNYGNAVRSITGKLRLLFLATFIFFLILGVSGRGKKEFSLPQNTGMPVISLTLDSETDFPTDNKEEPCGVTYGCAEKFPTDNSGSCAVICADTGKVLYAKNADTPMPMASTTKIMTALCALDFLPEQQMITVPPEVCGIEGSSIYLSAGEKLSVQDLLYGLLLESGNDAACALAFAACGNIEDFVSYMNRKAKDMGLYATHFENPHGLSAKGHVTTARELAVITYHALKNETFRKICGTKNYTVTDEKGAAVKYFSNHNRFLGLYEGAFGVKTGYTLNSGRCLVTSAKRGSSSFIAVTLNDRSDFADHAKLLDHAFGNYQTVNIAEKNSLALIIGGKTYTNNTDALVCTEKSAASLCDTEIILTKS